MKIRKLQLKNIGVFDDETIEFQSCPAKDKAEIHIFTGQNGTGKTTILMALASLFDLEVKNKPITEEDRRYYGEIKSQPDENRLFEAKLKLWKNNFGKRLRESKKESAFDFSTYINFVITHNEEQKEYKFNFEKLKEVRMDFINTLDIKNKLDEFLLEYSTILEKYPNYCLNFAAFAYSGYRRVKDEKINLFDKIEENPLYQALEFVKDERSKFTINQWLGRNLQKRALAKEENDSEAKRFDENIKNLEKVIADVIGYEIKFKLKTDLSLVLIKDNQELDFDVLPDGLKSLISWIGDLLMRLDSLKWENDTPIFEREIILFLDEIEVHLHPAWQRKVLPVVQKLFKNSQIFVSTHSPFVVNSIDDAWVYKLELENGKAKVADVVRSEDGISYQTVLSEIFGIDEEFGGKTQEDLDKFYKIVRNGKKINEKELLKLAKSLAVQSEELNSIVQIELRQLSRRKGKEFSL